MNTLEFRTPTEAEIRNAETRARQLRAEALRAGAIVIADFVKSLFHKAAHPFTQHGHA